MIFSDEQWERVRGDYPADLFARCRQELLGSILGAVLDRQPDEVVDRLRVEAVGDDFPIEFGPFDAFGWSPLRVSDELLAWVHATQLWPSVDPEFHSLSERS